MKQLPINYLACLGYKQSYKKDGVVIISAKLQGSYDAIIFDYKSEDISIKTVVCQGGLTRAERRAIVKAALLAFEADVLYKADGRLLNIFGNKMRYAFFDLESKPTTTKLTKREAINEQ